MQRRPVLAVAAVAVLVAAVALSWRPAQRYTNTLPPDQFYSAVDPRSVAPGEAMLGVAHNAGNSPTTATRALRHAAGAVEIDVISAAGTMVAGRPQPMPWLADRVFSGPTLAEAWRETAPAGTVLIDLKETDRATLKELVDFLRGHPTNRTVMISARDADALLYLDRHLASVVLLFTLAFPPAIDRLRQDPALQRAVDGVSAYEGLVDAGLVGWLHARHLTVVAWPVNDEARLRELASMGVDGITTDNLAILDLLGHPASAR